MGNISITVMTSFVLLVAYSLLIPCVNGKLQNPGDSSTGSGSSNDLLQKRPSPAVWLKTYAVRNHRPLAAIYRRDFQPDVEFVDDAVNDLEKRFDDYGHMRWVWFRERLLRFWRVKFLEKIRSSYHTFIAILLKSRNEKKIFLKNFTLQKAHLSSWIKKLVKISWISI